MYLNSELLISLRTGNMSRFLSQEKYEMYVREQPIGVINLPTGKIVANDPLCMFETEPFTETVSPGKYPVVLYVLHIDTDQRVAFAEIRFSDKIPVRFHPALLPNQNPKILKGDGFYGYGVDSGTGGFMDESTCAELKIITDLIDDGMLLELDKALDDSYVFTYSTANVCLPNSDHNVVAFSSGYGDGGYPSFWGVDRNGETCCLITDFCIIEVGNKPKEKSLFEGLFDKWRR